jgi:hypothetical protein
MLEKVNDYYLSHLDELSPDKQFHYLSRLLLWGGLSPSFSKKLDDHKVRLLGDSSPVGFRTLLQGLMQNPTTGFGSNHAVEKRKPLFQKYPRLQPANAVLFRLLQARNVFDQDQRELCGELFTLSDLDDLFDALLADEQALTYLSTHAVNFAYLYHCFVQGEDSQLITAALEQVSRPTPSADSIHKLMYCYMITHAVIGETQFYFQPLTNDKIPTYVQLLQQVESVIGESFQDINLDAKCEFLVCCRLTNYSSKLEKQIYDEASTSMSDDGDFIVDTHNFYRSAGLRSLDQSEHRNILLVLSQTPSHLMPSTL